MKPLVRSLPAAGPAAAAGLNEMLRNVWIAEAIRPSALLVVSAPVVEDCPLFDSRIGLSGMGGDGGRTTRLADLLLENLRRGGEVWLFGERPDDASAGASFLERIVERAAERGVAARLRTNETENLPTPGVFGDGFAVRGAMRLRASAVEFGGEGVAFEYDPSDHAPAAWRSEFQGRLR